MIDFIPFIPIKFCRIYKWPWCDKGFSRHILHTLKWVQETQTEPEFNAFLWNIVLFLLVCYFSCFVTNGMILSRYISPSADDSNILILDGLGISAFLLIQWSRVHFLQWLKLFYEMNGKNHILAPSFGKGSFPLTCQFIACKITYHRAGRGVFVTPCHLLDFTSSELPNFRHTVWERDSIPC